MKIIALEGKCCSRCHCLLLSEELL